MSDVDTTTTETLPEFVPRPPDGLADSPFLEWYTEQLGRVAWARQQLKIRAEMLADRLDREEHCLRQFHERRAKQAVQRAIEGTKKKSTHTLTGTAGFRRTQPTITVENEQQAKDAAKRAGLDVVTTRTVESISKARIREHLDTTGELLPGCRLEPAAEKFYVRTDSTMYNDLGELPEEDEQRSLTSE